MSYGFKDIIGTLGTPMRFTESNGIPITINFMYFDKDGKCWRVRAEGTQERVESNDRQSFRFTGFDDIEEIKE